MGNKSVCLRCGIACSYGMDYDALIPRTCPRCNSAMIPVDYKFQAPKKGARKKWETIKYLMDNGFYFQRVYENNTGTPHKAAVPYPRNLKEAKIFVETYGAQRITGNHEPPEADNNGKQRKHKTSKK